MAAHRVPPGFMQFTDYLAQPDVYFSESRGDLTDITDMAPVHAANAANRLTSDVLLVGISDTPLVQALLKQAEGS